MLIRKIFTYLILCLVSVNAFSQKTFTIPDNNLYTALKLQVPTAFLSNGLVDSLEASKYTGSIVCSNYSINNIDGLQYFNNVTSLDISSNSIDTLGVLFNIQFNNLTNFNCSSNKLKKLFPFTNCPNLENLDCSNNLLLELKEFESLQNLSKLNCSYNLIAKLSDLNLNSKLRSIDASFNYIKVIPLVSDSTYKYLTTNNFVINLTNNLIGFQQVDTSFSNILDSNKLKILGLNSQRNLKFEKQLSNTFEFDPGDTINLKIVYDLYKGDKVVWLLNNQELLEDTTTIFKRVLTKEDAGSTLVCRILNKNVIEPSQLTLQTETLVLGKKVHVCPDIRNQKVDIISSVCKFDNTVNIAKVELGYFYTLTNIETKEVLTRQDTVFNNIYEGSYKLTINNHSLDCVVDTANYKLFKVNSIKANQVLFTVDTNNCNGQVSINNYLNTLAYKLLNFEQNKIFNSDKGKFQNLNNGNYKLIISNNICNDTLKDNIIKINGLDASIYITTSLPNICKEKGRVVINNYNTTYDYFLSDLGSKMYSSTQNIFTNIPLGNYYLIVSNKIGTCVDTAQESTIKVTVINTNDFSFESSEYACFNQGSVIVKNFNTSLTYNLIDKANKLYSSISPCIFNNLPDATYTLIVSDSICTDTLSTNQIVIESLKASNFRFSIENATCIDDGKVKIANNFNSNLSYFLTNTISGVTGSAQNGIFSNMQPGKYIFSVQNKSNTCKDTLNYNLEIKSDGNCGEEVTPNGDGINDNLTILNTGDCKIFDRNGVLIAEFTSPAEWNCTNKNNQVVTTGIYALYINNVFNKTVTVFR